MRVPIGRDGLKIAVGLTGSGVAGWMVAVAGRFASWEVAVGGGVARARPTGRLHAESKTIIIAKIDFRILQAH
ncbi:MAG: hypothetical protein ABSA01_17565 [Anaerolineales bacterium]|jgi:hypothetical protein